MDIASRLIDFLLIAVLDLTFVVVILNIEQNTFTFQHECPEASPVSIPRVIGLMRDKVGKVARCRVAILVDSHLISKINMLSLTGSYLCLKSTTEAPRQTK